jgi:Na+/proline symporter
VSLVAIVLAFDRSSSILALVSYAWAGFGAAFGPIILLSLYWRDITRNGALAGMITGAVTVLFWLYAPVTIGGESLSDTIYALVPGFILSFAATVLVSLMKGKANPQVQVEYDEMMKAMSVEKQPFF